MSGVLEKSVRVRCSVEHAFDTFTARVDLWWPPGHRKLASSMLSFDAREGGLFVERGADGSENVLGVVVTVQRPLLLRYAWNPGRGAGPTDVEVRFTAIDLDGAMGTLVEVIHREGDSGLSDLWPARVALFDKGWSAVLPAFSQAAEAQA
jgi:uncharacterized protein YndB with AHSA1/START domain